MQRMSVTETQVTCGQIYHLLLIYCCVCVCVRCVGGGAARQLTGVAVAAAGAGLSDDDDDDDDAVDKPIFKSTPSNITVSPGDRAALKCQVENLGTKTVNNVLYIVVINY